MRNMKGLLKPRHGTGIASCPQHPTGPSTFQVQLRPEGVGKWTLSLDGKSRRDLLQRSMDTGKAIIVAIFANNLL